LLVPDPAVLGLFMVSSFLLLIIPGPSVLYVVALSLRQGRAAGLASVLGVGAGAFVHFLAAAVGLSALLVASVTAFSIVKWAGAVYLIYLGVRTLLSRDRPVDAPATPPQRSLPRVWAQGVLVSVLNPKLALFVLAFLPQFLDPSRGTLATQALILGAIFISMAAVTDSIYALTAGWLGGLWRRRAGALRAQRFITGGIYLVLGAATVVGVEPGGTHSS